MAIYHLSAQIIGRKNGGNAKAAAAYRAGEKIAEFDYTRKHGVDYKEILTPENTPEWCKNRAELWTTVESVEKRKDAQLCREINLALPLELKPAEREDLLKDFAGQFVSMGMVADITIHGQTSTNPHGHIMLTTRELTSEGFGQKVRDWNRRELLDEWRSQWAELANKALEHFGHEVQIDHRSLEAQGIDREPTRHKGKALTWMERKGPTLIGELRHQLTEQTQNEREIALCRAELSTLEKKQESVRRAEAEAEQKKEQAAIERLKVAYQKRREGVIQKLNNTEWYQNKLKEASWFEEPEKTKREREAWAMAKQQRATILLFSPYKWHDFLLEQASQADRDIFFLNPKRDQERKTALSVLQVEDPTMTPEKAKETLSMRANRLANLRDGYMRKVREAKVWGLEQSTFKDANGKTEEYREERARPLTVAEIVVRDWMRKHEEQEREQERVKQAEKDYKNLILTWKELGKTRYTEEEKRYVSIYNSLEFYNKDVDKRIVEEKERLVRFKEDKEKAEQKCKEYESRVSFLKFSLEHLGALKGLFVRKGLEKELVVVESSALEASRVLKMRTNDVDTCIEKIQFYTDARKGRDAIRQRASEAEERQEKARTPEMEAALTRQHQHEEAERKHLELEQEKRRQLKRQRDRDDWSR